MRNADCYSHVCSEIAPVAAPAGAAPPATEAKCEHVCDEFPFETKPAQGYCLKCGRMVYKTDAKPSDGAKEMDPGEDLDDPDGRIADWNAERRAEVEDEKAAEEMALERGMRLIETLARNGKVAKDTEKERAFYAVISVIMSDAVGREAVMSIARPRLPRVP